MSEDQLSALLAKLKDDEGLQEKLKGAADLDAVIAIAKEAGFDVSKADWLKHQANKALEMSDVELEVVAGGQNSIGCPGWGSVYATQGQCCGGSSMCSDKFVCDDNCRPGGGL